MRFLVDESCDFAAVRALRAAGHDVVAVTEIMQGSVDRDLVIQALEEKRILLTEDKDLAGLFSSAICNRLASSCCATLGTREPQLPMICSNWCLNRLRS